MVCPMTAGLQLNRQLLTTAELQLKVEVAAMTNDQVTPEQQERRERQFARKQHQMRELLTKHFYQLPVDDDFTSWVDIYGHK